MKLTDFRVMTEDEEDTAFRGSEEEKLFLFLGMRESPKDSPALCRQTGSGGRSCRRTEHMQSRELERTGSEVVRFPAEPSVGVRRQTRIAAGKTGGAGGHHTCGTGCAQAGFTSPPRQPCCSISW